MKPNEPTPAEIRLACIEIQRGWSPAERLRRLRCDLRPMVACADGRHVDVGAEDYDTHLANHEELTTCQK